MTNSRRFLGVLLAALAPAYMLVGFSSAPAQSLDIDKTAIEIQARGLIHEAFAQPIGSQPAPGPLVAKQPPPPVPEEPPEYQPKGDNLQWIPGYWAWDADRNDFLWISGTYRDAPGGRSYVPGYWEQTNDGWRWVSGFWAPANQAQLPYVPQPPEPLLNGPSVPAPGQDYSYVPGYWFYKETQFVWRPGYYTPCRLGMVWIPPRYIWTPGGFIFVSGYWDYPLEDRGLLFAPVYFSRPLWATPGWCWRPQYVVGCGPLLDSLFIDARYGHYRFGDYYGNGYVQRGIHPWHAFGPQRFDPLYGYYGWQNRGNKGWQTGLAQVHDARVLNKQLRPPQTLALLTSVTGPGSKNRQQFIQPLTQFSNGSGKLTKVGAPQVAQHKVFAQQQVAMSQNRQKIEATFATKATTNKTGTARAPNALQLPQLTQGIVAKTTTAPVVKTVTPAPGIKTVTPPVTKTVTPTPVIKTVTPPVTKTVTPAPAIKTVTSPITKTVTPTPAIKTVTSPVTKTVTPTPAIRTPTPPVTKTVTPPPVIKTVTPPAIRTTTNQVVKTMSQTPKTAFTPKTTPRPTQVYTPPPRQVISPVHTINRAPVYTPASKGGHSSKGHK
jgi:hypothetical protein